MKCANILLPRVYSLLFVLLLGLAVILPVKAQESNLLPTSSETDMLISKLSNLDKNEILKLFFNTLVNLKIADAQEQLNWENFRQSMDESFESLTMQMLDSKHTVMRLQLQSITDKKTIESLKQSGTNLNDDGKQAIKEAKTYKFVSIIEFVLIIILSGGWVYSAIF